MIANTQRRAFTLIEILIVLGIIVAVAAIFVPVVLNLSERNQVPKAASLLENALSIAKARAVSEKRPSGIRLIAAADNLRTLTNGTAFAWYDEIQYVESPYDYSEHWVWGVVGSNPALVVQPFWAIFGDSNPAAPSPGALPLGLDTVIINGGPYTFNALVDSGNTVASVTVPRQQCVFGPISTITGSNQWTSSTGINYKSQRLQFDFLSQTPRGVQQGDRIEIHGVGELFTVIAVSQQNQDISVAPSARVIVPIIVLDRAIPHDIAVPLNGRPNYRVIRQPRAVPSLPPVRLPQDVVIDVTPTRFPLLGAGGDLNQPPPSTIFMSGVSLGIGTSEITGLTNPMPASGIPEIAPPYIDIMFGPSGEVLPTSQTFGFTAPVRQARFSVGSSGLIAMWLHSRGDPNLWAARQATAAQGNADNQALVSINARTGFIGSYPMTPLSISTDPLLYVRTGKARISADTGQ